MGKAISLFSGYSQGENRTTNYCLLILKLLYEENPKLLGDVLNSLPNIDIGDTVGAVGGASAGAEAAARTRGGCRSIKGNRACLISRSVGDLLPRMSWVPCYCCRAQR